MEVESMSTNLVAVNKETRLTMPAPEYSNEQIKLLAETVAKGCDQNELAFFLQVAKLKRLDPFTGQIHVVKRWDSSLGKEKISIQTGVDGYRAIASRTGDLAGIDDPEYDSEVEEHPNWAKITVYRYGRGDEKVPYRATARWGEYVQTYKDKQTGELKPNPMWKRMPYLMLGKVAESLALRKAFPDELSGMYTNEEMGQADNETPGITPASVAKPQVAMPKSTDEKKPPVQTQQQGKAETSRESKEADTSKTTTTAATTTGSTVGGNSAEIKPERISGTITDVRQGTGKAEGMVFLIVDKKIIVIPPSLVDAEMVTGANILLDAEKKPSSKGDTYTAFAVEMVVPPIREGEIIDAEVSEPEVKREPGQPDPVLEEARSAGLGGIFDEAPPKTKAAENPGQEAPPATEATKPGTAGLKRAQRLHTLISQNHKNTGFTEDLLKKYLATQRLEHARDLACPPKGSEAFNAYEYACGMAVGEIDWHEILED
jgi:phage recombination protein Bet